VANVHTIKAMTNITLRTLAMVLNVIVNSIMINQLEAQGVEIKITEALVVPIKRKIVTINAVIELLSYILYYD
jgi:hypothetical protein